MSLFRPTETRSSAPPLARLEGRMWLARLAILWERTWPALWPVMAALGSFAALALFDLLPGLPGWLHALVLAGFIAALGTALWAGARGLRFPGPGRARRRLESQSGLAHRPLGTLLDHQATGADDSGSRVLWALHRRRMIESIRELRIGVPAAGLTKRDPMALRVLLGLVLTVAVVGAWGEIPKRLAHALTPNFSALGAVQPVALDLWITPPAYTGLAPLFMQVRGTQQAGAGRLAIPTGSTLLAQLHGGQGNPTLQIDGDAKPFNAVDDGAYKITATLDSGSHIVVTQDKAEVAAWPLTVIADIEPWISLAEPPAQTQRAALMLRYEATDDYGVTEIKAFIRSGFSKRFAKGKSSRPQEIIEFALPVPGKDLKTIKETSYHDLTAHPWAGLPASIQLMATDGTGQVGVSESYSFVMPERIFRHPVARAIISVRRQLSLNPDDRKTVMQRLYELSTRPKAFGELTAVFLALRTAQARLRFDPSDTAVAAVQALLWDTALALEDGRLSLAQRELRSLQKALMDALSRRASNAEIDKLMQKLQTALSKFLQQLMKDLKNIPLSAMPFDPSARFITPQDLQRMLDRARQLARTGSYDAARQLLAMLQEMLERLRSGTFAWRRGRGGGQASRMMRDLRNIMRSQQELLDRSFRHQREGTSPMPGPKGSQAMQDALRRRLGDLMRRFGEATGGQIPKPFGRAERFMRDAEGALGRKAPGQAVGPQGQALDQLQQGAGAMMRELAKRFGRGRGYGRPRGQGRRSRPRYDPLGRPLPSAGTYSSEDVEIPSESDIQRAREILDELRRRAGQIDRPTLEREYIDRLLRRF